MPDSNSTVGGYTLLRCPFDGGAAILTSEEDFEVGGYFAGCSTCAASMWGETKEEAAAGWNTRTTAGASS